MKYDPCWCGLQTPKLRKELRGWHVKCNHGLPFLGGLGVPVSSRASAVQDWNQAILDDVTSWGSLVDQLKALSFVSNFTREGEHPRVKAARSLCRYMAGKENLPHWNAAFRSPKANNDRVPDVFSRAALPHDPNGPTNFDEWKKSWLHMDSERSVLQVRRQPDGLWGQYVEVVQSGSCNSMCTTHPPFKHPLDACIMFDLSERETYAGRTVPPHLTYLSSVCGL